MSRLRRSISSPFFWFIRRSASITFLSGLVLIADRDLLNQKATSVPLGNANLHTSKADAQAEALARNSQVINAMGMLNESILHWGSEQARALIFQASALDRSFWISGASKCARLVTQIVISVSAAYSPCRAA